MQSGLLRSLFEQCEKFEWAYIQKKAMNIHVVAQGLTRRGPLRRQTPEHLSGPFGRGAGIGSIHVCVGMPTSIRRCRQRQALLAWVGWRSARLNEGFEGRYKAILVEPGNCFWALLDYLHLNPVRAGLV